MSIENTAGVSISSRKTRLMAAVVAGFAGLFIVWTVGFAQPSALHNAAHDSRHSFAFPCH